MWSPASILTITEIPRASASRYGNVSKSLIPSETQVTSITSDPETNTIFTSIRNSIYAFSNFSIWQNQTRISRIYKGKSTSLGQIAFDYVSKNLYWCDSLLDWIAMKPAYTSNNTIYKVVVDKDMKQPEGIALDAEDGLMFFSDNGPNPRIERASMDGSDRVVIAHTGLIRVLALSIDIVSNILYWADYGRHTLDACNYDGSSRRVLRRMNQVTVTGIHYNQNMLHVVSPSTRGMIGIDTTSGSPLYNIQIDTGQPFVVHVYDAETSISYNDPCSSRGCQHMCVKTPMGPTCLCAEGFQLSTDNLTCTDRSWFHEKGFIVNNATTFSMLEVSSVSAGEGLHPSFRVSSVIQTFTVDAKLDLIYFVDNSDNSLKELNIITSQIRTLASISYAKALVFDWIANLLGWIEPTQSSIRAFSINSGTMSTIYSGLQEPSSLTVDPHNSYLYWISGSSGKSIMRGTWSRDTPQVILSSANVANPSSLQYDVTSDRIYWLDNSLIKSSMTNGSDIKTHIVTLGATQALVYKDFFVWINGNQMSFARKSGLNAEYAVNILENSNGVAVFDRSLQQDRRGTCHIMNGGCEDICVPTRSGRRCECDVGLKIKSDNTTCDSDVFSTNFIVVADYSHGRILQVDIDTGNLVKLPFSTNSPGIILDKSSMKLFYSQISTKSIMSTTLHGRNTTLVYAIGFAYADRMVIDYSTGNIYYTAVGSTPSQSYIGVIHRMNSLHKTLLSNLYSPREIVVYPSKGFLYWTEFGNVTQIGRAYMDGTSKMYIATTDIGWPNGLTIDFTSSRLYWTDGQKNRIEYSDLNGGNRGVLATDNDAHLMSMVIHGQYLYYTAWNRQRITKMDKSTGSKVVFMLNHPELGRLDSLAIYADDVVDVNTICSKLNGNCSTFCFPTPSGRTCGCQDNVDLQSDQSTCQGVTRCSTSLQNVNVLNCLPYSGQTCDIECKTGYKLAVNTSITCGTSGQWSPPTAALCTEIFCPPSVDNVVLSSSCGRKVGEACKFSCTEGHTSTTSQNLVCKDDGTWNQNMSDLCTHTGCSKTVQNGYLINCKSNAGDTCRYECNSPMETNPSIPNIACGTNGDWNHDTNDLCVLLCPSTIPNGELAQSCQRRVGNSCTFTCSGSHRPSTSQNLFCTSKGTWSENIDLLCKQIACPLEIKNGNISSLCQGRTGEKCKVTCHTGFVAKYSEIFCTLSGVWDRKSDDICTAILDNPSPSPVEETDITLIGVGASITIIVIAIAIVAIVCFVRRRKQPGNEYEQSPAARENPYSTFINGGYLTDMDTSSHGRPVSDVYCSIEDSHFTEYGDSVKETYLNPISR
ncbi:low-density lipoprotein receptor-related protein 4-like [Ostrea edulis]|uniref:low-density lipoprotein receptor-related protein 4-like n=1 Tax=Ostrea edulis TaxID=37623 RepID=UPI0024AF38F0|nr:low-density lipoprotein receptor-related protein 4-like [Ostrea edulis]